MARGVDGREVFIDDKDRRDFLTTARRLKAETSCSILAYCLMGNHFHFAIKVENTPLSRIMHRLLTTYVLGFNARHERDGHLFQARYKSFLCLDDAYLIALIRYIHMNPVRAGLTSNPGDWSWSSHREYAGRADDGLSDTRLFCAAVNDTNNHENWTAGANADFEPWPQAGTTPPLLRTEPESAASLDALATSLFPSGFEEIKSGGRRHGNTRKKLAVATKAVENGHTLVSIAAWMKCTPSAIHHLLRRRQ